MQIDLATVVDLQQLVELDHHVSPAIIEQKIARGEIIVARDADVVVGWLRWGYFWDMIPFMNLLGVRAPLRGQGIGTRIVAFWEAHLRAQGYTEVLTSTQADERGQFLYRKLGYQDVGALIFPGEPLEVILKKIL